MRVRQDGVPVFVRHLVTRTAGPRPGRLLADDSGGGQFFHLFRGRHAPARRSVGHPANRTYQEQMSRVRRWSQMRKKVRVWTALDVSEPCVPVRLESDPPLFGVPRTMAPRANWKGFLRLSLVNCPVALYPATSESEKVSFNQLNRKTGHRIKYAKVDADTGEEVANEDIVKGYKVDTDTFIEVTKDELENVALESTR